MAVLLLRTVMRMITLGAISRSLNGSGSRRSQSVVMESGKLPDGLNDRRPPSPESCVATDQVMIEAAMTVIWPTRVHASGPSALDSPGSPKIPSSER